MFNRNIKRKAKKIIVIINKENTIGPSITKIIIINIITPLIAKISKTILLITKINRKTTITIKSVIIESIRFNFLIIKLKILLRRNKKKTK
jgi:hypothetical protein